MFDNLLTFVRENIRDVALVLIMGLGVLIVLGARKAKWSDTLGTVGIIIVGAVLIGASGVLLTVGADIGSEIAP